MNLSLIIFMAIVLLLPSCQQSQSAGSKQAYLVSENLGVKQFIWHDHNRLDEIYGGDRIINAQVWYPANDISSERTPYYYKIDSVWKNLNHWSEEDFESVSKVMTKSYLNSPISSGSSTYPLIIFSPSLGGNLSQYTYYAEQLASRGFIVLGLNHLYESEYVLDKSSLIFTANHAFHDSLKTLEIPKQITAEAYRKAKGQRHKVLGLDIIFSLNQLLKEPFFKTRIDLSKIGAFGHSIGGASVIYASMLDDRIKAVIDLDGTPPTFAFDQGLSVPFLFIEDLTDFQNHPGYAKLHQRRNNFCQFNKSDSWRILIAEANHNSFLDTHYFLENDIEAKRKALKFHQLTANFMSSFFDSHLNDRPILLEAIDSDTLKVLCFIKD
ncbi:MAG: hypothetical protein JXQ90_19105 [Cyclobacteriaceae bacterium]